MNRTKGIVRRVFGNVTYTKRSTNFTLQSSYGSHTCIAQGILSRFTNLATGYIQNITDVDDSCSFEYKKDIQACYCILNDPVRDILQVLHCSLPVTNKLF